MEVGKDGAASTQELRLRVQDTYARRNASFGLIGSDAAPESNPDGDGFDMIWRPMNGNALVEFMPALASYPA